MSEPLSLLTHLVAWYGRTLRHPGRWRTVSALASLFRLHPTGTHQVSSAGLHWTLDPSDHQQSGVFWLGEMDRWERYHLASHLPSDGVFLDIGANFGYYSISLAKSTGARVFAFEPQPQVLQRLAEHIALNGLTSQITVQPLALADTAGRISLTTYSGNTGKTSLSLKPGDVPMMRLDDWIESTHLNRIDAIKIDVEGVEPRVLRGSVETLRRYRPKLLLEVNPVALARQGFSAVLLAQLLHNAGYSINQINRSHLVPIQGLSDSDPALNIFCLPSNS